MRQTWDKLLFMHWPMPEAVLRPNVPSQLNIDTHDGTAWIGITPFTMPNIRLRRMPAVPFASSSHEINVRTYVHYQTTPGVWFFSLDADNLLAVLGARIGFALPYFRALIMLEQQNDAVHFTSRRKHPTAPNAGLDVTWRSEGKIFETQRGTLDFFLTERYCLYATRRERLYRTRIFHSPWPLRHASLISFSSTMLESHGFPKPERNPLLLAQAAPLEVEIWSPSKVLASCGG